VSRRLFLFSSLHFPSLLSTVPSHHPSLHHLQPSKVPLDGFASLQGMRGPQRFSIHRAYNTSLLPTAHTCFNQLDLPAYSSLEEMRERLLVSIREGNSGFGFA